MFRSADGNLKGNADPGDYGWGTITENRDIYVDLNIDNFISITQPTGGDIFVNRGESIAITAEASSSVTSMKILLDEGSGFNEVSSIPSGTSINYNYTQFTK